MQVEALVDEAGALAFEPCRAPNGIFTPAARLQVEHLGTAEKLEPTDFG
jgi:hypothetical protein